LIIKIVPNIFEKQVSKEGYQAWFRKTTGELFDEQLIGDRGAWVPIVNGAGRDWDYVPAEADEVIFTNDLEAFAAPLVAYLGSSAFWVAAGKFVAMALISAAIGYVVSSIFAPSLEIGKAEGFDQSQTYSWDGIKNIVGEGNPVPIVYGRHKIGGAIVEAFVDGEEDGYQPRQYLNALFATSEGPVWGLEPDSIKIDNNELTNYGGGIQTWERTGEINQSPIPNFSKVARHYKIMSTVRLTQNTPYIYKTYNDVDMLKVSINVPAIFTMSGQDMQESYVYLKYEWAHVDSPGVWGEIGTQAIHGRTRAATVHDMIIDFNWAGLPRGQYLIRITRTSENYDSDPMRAGDTILDSVTEYERSQCAYINTSLYGVRIKATDKLSGMMPTFTAILKGVRVLDVRTRIYDPNTYRNPANQIYDLITNKRYGLGRLGIDENNIDMPSLITFANWADEIVTHQEYNPKNGMMETIQQKRYEFDIVIDAAQKVSEIIEKICSSCRVMHFWQGNKIKFVPERIESDYAQVFGMGNILKDSFEETYIGWNDIPNQVEVQVLDAGDDWNRTTIVAIDKDRVNEPVNSSQINMYGICDTARAKREAVFALKKPQGTRRSIKFGASIQAVMCEPGDLILFQHDVPQYGFSGNVVSVSDPVVKLDREVPLVAGVEYRLRIRRRDNVPMINQFVAAQTETVSEITTATGTAGLEEGDIWHFGEVDKEGKPFRVMSITNRDDMNFNIEAAEYNISVFNEDPNVDVYDQSYSALGVVATYDVDGAVSDYNNRPIVGESFVTQGTGNANIPPFVTDVQVREELVLDGVARRSDIVVDFGLVGMPANSTASVTRYQVWYSADAGVTWIVAGESFDGRFRIQNVSPGTYHVVVKPYTNLYTTNSVEISTWKLAWPVTVLGDTVPPLAPANLTAVGGLFCIHLNFTYPVGAGIDGVEIWHSTVNDRNAAELVATVKSGHATHVDLYRDVYHYYWIRSRNVRGLYSEWFPQAYDGGVRQVPGNDPTQVLDVLTGSLTASQLSAELSAQVNDTGEMQTQVLELENGWGIKTSENGHVVGVGSILYPVWKNSDTYSDGQVVWYNSQAYAAMGNVPVGDSYSPENTSYWRLVPYGVRSEFIIRTDRFVIVNPSNPTQIDAPFVVGSIGGISKVGINGDLAVDGSIRGRALVVDAVTTRELSVGAADETVIKDGAVTTTKVRARNITGDHVAFLTLTGDHIAVGSIQVDRLNAITLSAIRADLGYVTGGTIALGDRIFIGNLGSDNYGLNIVQPNGAVSSLYYDGDYGRTMFAVNWPPPAGQHGVYFNSQNGRLYLTGQVVENANVSDVAGFNYGKVGVAYGSVALSSPNNIWHTVNHNMGRYALITLSHGGVITEQTMNSFTFTHEITDGNGTVFSPGTVNYSWI